MENIRTQYSQYNTNKERESQRPDTTPLQGLSYSYNNTYNMILVKEQTNRLMKQNREARGNCRAVKLLCMKL